MALPSTSSRVSPVGSDSSPVTGAAPMSSGSVGQAPSGTLGSVFSPLSADGEGLMSVLSPPSGQPVRARNAMARRAAGRRVLVTMRGKVVEARAGGKKGAQASLTRATGIPPLDVRSKGRPVAPAAAARSLSGDSA